VTTRPSALVLEDSRSEREELTSLLSGLGLEVWATSSPVKARSRISRYSDYDLAVIDWDMSHSEDSIDERTSQRVLEVLARDARETLTLVYARDVMRVRVNDAIQRAHPGALVHDKAHGSLSLQRRLAELLSPHVGDLELDERYRNYVRHVPTGRLYKHRAAFKLVTNHPRDVMILREERAMWSGLDRFRRWLGDVDSVVTVESLGKWTQRYRLVVQGEGHASDNRRTH